MPASRLAAAVRRAPTLAIAFAMVAAVLFVAGTPAAGAATRALTLTPAAATNEPGSDHTVTATLTKDGSPEPGVKLAFDIAGGPNSDQSSAGGGCVPATCDTDANGQVTWTYISNNQEGQDTIVAVVPGDNTVPGATALKTWTKTRDKNPITDRWPDLTAAEEKSVQDLLSAGKNADALAKLVEVMGNHCCSFATMFGAAPIYDAGLAARGGNDVSAIARDKGGRLWIGPGAFGPIFSGDDTSAVARLYSILKQAMVHSQQWQDPAAAAAQGVEPRERQATQREIDNVAGTDVGTRYQRYLAEKLKSPSAATGIFNPRLRFELNPSKRVYRPGEAIPVTMAIRNITSADTLSVNGRLNVDDAGIPGDLREVFFAIKAPSGKMLELAIDQNSSFPSPDDFVAVAPGNSARRDADLNALFPFSELGEYEVCATYESALVGPVVYDTTSDSMVVSNVGAQIARNPAECVKVEVQSFTGDNVGLVDTDQGRWYLRNSQGVQTVFFFGDPGDVPLAGDWDGDDTTTVGMYRPTDGFFYARNSNTGGIADFACFAGDPDDVPLAGDWDGDGVDTLGLYRPENQTFFLFNEPCDNQPMGAAPISFVFGDAGDQPFAGDLDDDGRAEGALHRPSTGLVYYRNTLSTGAADASFIWGNPADEVFAGDWDADGRDTVGLFRPSDSTFYLRNSNTAGPADVTFPFGQGTWLPVAGAWGFG